MNYRIPDKVFKTKKAKMLVWYTTYTLEGKNIDFENNLLENIVDYIKHLYFVNEDNLRYLYEGKGDYLFRDYINFLLNLDENKNRKIFYKNNRGGYITLWEEYDPPIIKNFYHIFRHKVLIKIYIRPLKKGRFYE